MKEGPFFFRKVLTIVIVSTFFIRFIGIVPGHPTDHPDEPMSFGSAIEMIIHSNLDPRRFDYPAGVPLVHYVFFQAIVMPVIYFKVLFLHPRVLIAALQLGREQFFSQYSVAVFGINGITFLYWSRFLTAAMGTLSVYLVFLIGKRLFSPSVGLVSAFFLAFNYRHVLSSHLALSDIPNGLFALLAFYSTTLLLEKNTRRRYLLCALMVGVSIAMKYQIFSIFPYLFAHLVWVVRRRTTTELFNKYFIYGIVIIPLVFVLLNPYFFAYLPKSWDAVQTVSRRYGMGAYRFNFYPLFYLFHWGIGKIPMIAIITGLVLGIGMYPLRSAFLLTFIGPYLYIFLYYMTGGTYVRNFTTVIPFLFLFSGITWHVLRVFLSRFFAKNIALFIAIAILVVGNYGNMINSVSLAQAYTKPWNRQLLTDWVIQYMPPQSTVINDNVGIPSSIEKPLVIIPWDYEQGNAITEFIEQRRDFVVLNTAWNQINFFWFGVNPRDLIRYDGIPAWDLWDSYHGLLISEYKRYVVKEIYKPWQAPDDSYLVLKIPPEPISKGMMVTSFLFTKGSEGWEFYDFNTIKSLGNIRWNAATGHDSSGSLEAVGLNRTNYHSRVISPFLPVTRGYTYQVDGYIKPGSEIKSNLRDAFLRIDYYPNNDPRLLEHGTIAAAVSGRVFGPLQWRKESVISQAPEGSAYMTVSFQRANPDTGMDYLLDDVRVYESKEKLYRTDPKIPYIIPTIHDTELFPNSIY